MAVAQADAAHLLLGDTPDADLLRGFGIEVDPETRVPAFDPDSCEPNVPGLYVGGTLQAGRRCDRIFIDNSRNRAPHIVRHLAGRLRRSAPRRPLGTSR